MNALDAATRLASAGYAVLPIRPGSKAPDTRLAPHGVHSASTDSATINAWFATGQHNVAIAVPEHVLVIDVDPNCKKGSGIVSLTALVKKFGRLPAGPRQVSGSGGIHLLFMRPERSDLRGKLDVKLHPGVDLLCHGKYFVCAPSVHPNGNAYRWTRAPWECDLPQLPIWFQDLASDDYVPTVRSVARPGSADVVKRAKAYLAKCEPAVSGQGGHDTTFKVACALCRGFDLDEEAALELLESSFNIRCDPPWSRRELRHKIRQAIKLGKDEWGKFLSK